MAAHADMSFAAPGLDSVQSYQGLNLQEAISLGKYWRYEVSGYEWRLVAGKPFDGDINPETGKLVISKNDNGQYQGSSTAQSSVAGSKSGTQWVIEKASLSALNIQDTATGSDSFASPIVFNDETVTVGFRQVTNMTNDYGSYIVLQGACIKEPPVPTGSMVGPELVEVDSLPEIQYSIKREGITGTSPSFTPAPWSPELTPGDSTATPTTDPTDTEEGDKKDEESSETPNSGKNKTNNGHGNNEDGVDVSNPGKSAEKWAAKGIKDTDTNGDGVIDEHDDDESTGGGAAPSK